MKEIIIDGKKYVEQGSTQKLELAKPKGNLPYKIIRTYSAGVFAGYLKKKEGKEVTLLNARRLWKWVGAASLSQLAMEGVKEPDKCMFPCEVSQVVLTEVIEIIDVTKEAFESIKGVPIWQK